MEHAIAEPAEAEIGRVSSARRRLESVLETARRIDGLLQELPDWEETARLKDQELHALAVAGMCLRTLLVGDGPEATFEKPGPESFVGLARRFLRTDAGTMEVWISEALQDLMEEECDA